MNSAEPVVEGSTSSNQQPRRPFSRRRPQRPKANAPDVAATTVEARVLDANPVDSRAGSPRQSSRARQQPRQLRQATGQADRLPPKPRAPRPPKRRNDQGGSASPADDSSKDAPAPSRRSNFGGKLTSTTIGQQIAGESYIDPSKTKPSQKYRTVLPQGDDLTSSLIRLLSTPPYPDCPICFASIHPAQPAWSCSPATPVVPSAEGQVHYCWTSFHTKCIKAWAGKSVKEMADAWKARGEHGKVGEWRCPGCQAKREIVPSGHWCFCGAVPDPKLTRLSTPHSCGKPCSRVRDSGCGHSCPLLCHPGPCPPCQVITQLECYCPRSVSLSFRCGADIDGKRDLSCGNTCGSRLKCGNHLCETICHEGECEICPVTEVVKCYCGKEEKEVACGEGKHLECFVEGEAPWIGRYSCDRECQQPFDCGVHRCTKPCHPPSPKPEVCPRSPLKVKSCPCGQSLIAPPNDPNPSLYAFPPRLNCEARIPTCTSPCSKPQPQCSHPCEATCHSGTCPPCNVTITRPCRCGASTRRIACHDMYAISGDGDVSEKEIMCDRPCSALRACGRHQCRRICCPLASLALSNKKGKKRATPQTEPGIGEERGGLHECDLVCGQALSCGNHRCEERDHRGACPPCLRSSFQEMFCPCGRTMLEPPVPCGTVIECNYPCPRPPPACGHPVVPHSCHDDSLFCPPCPHLTSKPCACGKKDVPNVKCSLEREKVLCGSVCGKLMSCGFHHCESSCHSGDCGPCTAPCGKTRKLCLPSQHPCTRPCHAPAACPESEPCEATITVTCSCGRIKQAIKCGRQISHPLGHQVTPPKCTRECNIAQRNAKLAEALGINPDSGAKDKATYNDEVVAFARNNSRFVPVVETAFSEFVGSDKRIKVLPHMPPEKRKFVHDLASVYRMDTQLIDQEPQRSVQLIRRIDTRIPSPLLSAYLASLAPTPNFGRLTDLRTIKSSSPSWPSSKLPSASSSGSSSRGWGSAAGTNHATTSRPTGAIGSVFPPSVATAATPSPFSVASSSRQSLPRIRSRVDVVSPPDATVMQEEEQKPVTDDWEDDL